jgi:hypothetical protein
MRMYKTPRMYKGLSLAPNTTAGCDLGSSSYSQECLGCSVKKSMQPVGGKPTVRCRINSDALQ